LIPPYGSPGWTANDTEILIYDQYDIWIMKPDGSSRKRLTNGERTGTVYRLSEKRLPPSPRDSFIGFRTQVYNINKNIVLKTQNSMTLAEGFAIRNMNGTIKHLFEKASIVHIMKLIFCLLRVILNCHKDYLRLMLKVKKI
jgi:Tol biopolymer transport system component